jgi:hypothetical protein
MRRRNGRMTVEGTDTDATQGAAMGICRNDGPPETLISNGRKVYLLHRQCLFYSKIFGVVQQTFAIQKSATVGDALLYNAAATLSNVLE